MEDKLKEILKMALYHDGWITKEGISKPLLHPKLGPPKWVIEAYQILGISMPPFDNSEINKRHKLGL
jgi:hypothetical protein